MKMAKFLTTTGVSVTSNISKAFNDFRKDTINILKMYYRFIICFFIAIAFIRLFLLLQEYNYDKIIAYGEKVTILIGALAALTFSYANTFENPEKKDVREIGERFLISFLYFVIGLIFSIGFREGLRNPSGLSIFPDILAFLSYIIMFILFLTGFVMLLISAVYLGIGIDDLTKWLLKNMKYEKKSLNSLQQHSENMKPIESREIRNNWLKNININKKTIGITIYLLIVLLSFFFSPLIFIIVVSFFILLISGIFPILYYIQLLKQSVHPEDYYLKFVEKNYSYLDEPLLIKMYDIRINNQRNFLFSYLGLMVAFTFATLSNKDYFKNIIIYGALNQYYYFISLGILGILVLIYATYGFDRFTLKELEILIEAMERLKELKRENISQPITQK